MSTNRRTHLWILWIGLLILALSLGACGGKPAATAAPTVAATQPSAAQPTAAVQPAQPGAAQATQPAAVQPSPTPAAKASATTKPAAGKYADPDELNSYRMKTTTWEKGGDKAKASVIVVEWVKDPPSKHTTMGSTEIITIRDQTWVKLMGRWVLQDRQTPQPQSSDISANIMRQVEDKMVYKEVGRETVNGVACKKYTYSGEATVQIAEGALKGEATVKGQGESWVADQPGLPAVVIRNIGVSETKMKAPAGSGATGDIVVAMNMEMELYDINTPITIKPPTDVFTPPVAPTTVAGRPTATRGAGPTVQPGLASLTPIPELKACFDGFPLPASAQPDSVAAGAARIIAAGLGSPSEARGYKTTDPTAQVQQFIETKALAAGWELGTMMQGQNLQYWAKDRFFLVLNILPPSGDRKETAIALACGMGKASTPAAAKPTATVAAKPPTATTAASAPTPAGEASTVDFAKPLDRSWYRQGAVDAEVGVEARPGYLHITAASGSDLLPGLNFDAPALYRVVGGDFTVETAVEFEPQEDYQGAGLFIWQDEENFVRLERCYGGLGGGESGICFLKVEKGVPEVIAAAGDIPTTAPRVELRLQKLKNNVGAWWRDASAGATAAWQPVGSTTIELPGGPQPLTKNALRAGMLLCVGAAAAETSADFDDFKMWQQ
jgi:hypothetical protein